MSSAVPALLVAAALCGVAASLHAEPTTAATSLGALGELRRNGELSRRLFVPRGAPSADERVSAGLAVGLKGAVRQQMGSVAPSVSMRVSEGSKLSVLAAPGHGAMVVLQAGGW
jgi:hypothetical protein